GSHMATFQTDADFLLVGDDTSRYEEVMKTFDTVEAVRKSDLDDRVYMVCLKQGSTFVLNGGIEELRLLTGDSTLEIQPMIVPTTE
uniref:wsv230 n=1 Tax=White spot syndrome virus TaxID=92652 RepID=UPI0000E11D82|nr:Chain A, wsv230 [Shrimp white spot syndrome virus]2GJ2_B Chain B, wsv230 [Shrimp white spot syndrome virus]2GJ2_C Chain C, wsv230 [Shrimp white spot syndrome virus]2GJ2_D Chain D, wsv230 [Shrimp white spot syndrome virus]2GJI_A Chain A, wsv230 [Shrimp white spot syndrome virus]